MSAIKQQSTLDKHDEVQLARQLLEANQLYAYSNTSGHDRVAKELAQQKAEKLISQVLAADSQNAPALGLLGRIYLDRLQLAEAAHAFESAIAIAPDSAQLVANMGYLAMKQGDYAQAETYFRQALDCDGQFVQAFQGIAHCLAGQGKFDLAYLHFQRLLGLGINNEPVIAGLTLCCSKLKVERYTVELEQTLVTLFGYDNLPFHKLGRIAAELLCAKYDLDNPEARFDMQSLASDPLLLAALRHTLMPSAQIELFIGSIRRALLNDTLERGELLTGWQDLALAIGIYINRVGHVLPQTESETQAIDLLLAQIQAETSHSWSIENVAGALIITGMYVAHFHQKYSFNLSAVDVSDWPAKLRPLMSISFYDLIQEESYKQQFNEKSAELLLDKHDIPRAWPFWSALDFYHTQQIKRELCNALNINSELLPDTLTVMVLGTQSSQRALELAKYFTDVEVIAVDEDLSNLASGQRYAKAHNIDNIVFWPYSLAARFIADGNALHYVEVGRFPSDSQHFGEFMSVVNKGIHKHGVIHLHTGNKELESCFNQLRTFTQANQISPSLHNIREIRRIVMTEKDSMHWQALLKDESFYSMSGCWHQWFKYEQTNHIEELLASLTNELEWRLVRARDADTQLLDPQVVFKQLRNAKFASDVCSLIGYGLSLDFVKR